jgi:hypothetical protein
MKKILLNYLEAHYNSQCPYTYYELHKMIITGLITSKPQLIDDLKAL